MFLPLTDFVAMAGIVLVACAVSVHLYGWVFTIGDLANAKSRWLVGLCFVVMWIPVGVAHLPVAAYVRGVTSDFSVSLVVLAALNLYGRLFSVKPFDRREHQAVFYGVAAMAIFLYPLALGWGDWDAYRLGWGSVAMWAGLLLVCVVCWVARLRLLPLLIGLAMALWTAQLLESTNLWDYLLDPWLATVAIVKSVAAGTTQLRSQFYRKKTARKITGEII